MIDVLINIIDRLTTIKKAKIENRKALLSKIFEPIFTDLLMIHGDYMKIFTDVHWKLPGFDPKHPGSWENPEFYGDPPGSEGYEKKIEAAKSTLKTRRLEFEPVRIKVRAFADTLRSEGLKAEEYLFIEAVIKYFPSGEWSWNRSISETILHALEWYGDDSAFHIGRLLDETINDHKLKWSDVCESFAVLKLVVTREY